MAVFGVEGILQAFKGSKPKPKINWYKVARAPQRAAASAHFKDRYPVRGGRSMRDHGDMVVLLSDDCSDVTEQEEEEEPDGMIDDFDTEADFADLARMMVREAKKQRRV